MALKDIFEHPGVPAIASRGLLSPTSLSPDEIRAVCATALRHVPDHRQAAMVGARPLHEQIDMALAVMRCNNHLSEAAFEPPCGLDTARPARRERDLAALTFDGDLSTAKSGKLLIASANYGA
jgi:hypothetical protein